MIKERKPKISESTLRNYVLTIKKILTKHSIEEVKENPIKLINDL